MAEWNEFQKSMKGKGKSSKEISKLYKPKPRERKIRYKNLHKGLPTKRKEKGIYEGPLTFNQFVLSNVKKICHISKYCIEILKQGVLFPRKVTDNHQWGGDGRFIYLDPESTKRDGKHYTRRHASMLLYFKPSLLLDRNDYYLGNGWNYGDIEHFKYYRKDKFHKWLKKAQCNREYNAICCNEILFENPIEIDKYISKIIIKGHPKEILDQIPEKYHYRIVYIE